MEAYAKFSNIPYLKPYLDELVVGDKITEYAAHGVIYVKDGIVGAFKQLMNFTISAFSGMVNLFLIPILTFYVLLDMDEIFESGKMLLPPAYKKRILEIFSKLDEQLSKMLRGQIFSNSVFAILMTIALWISGINFFTFLGPLSGLANFIPYLGGLFTVVFAVLIAIVQFGFSKASIMLLIKVGIGIAVVQTIDAWYLQPYVVGENVACILWLLC